MKTLVPAVFVSVVGFVLLACGAGLGTLGDDCSSDSDCSGSYSCVQCSGQNTCYFEDSLDGDSDYEWACDQYGSGTPTDSRYRGSGGSTSGSSTSGSCGESVWTCAYDGQATPMCQWACSHSGSERQQTCQVLAGMVESGNAGECCTVCR